jgi:hypothetical protein
VVGAKDLKGPNGTTNINQGSGQHLPDAQKPPVVGGTNAAHPTALGTPPKTSGIPKGTRGTELNAVHPPSTTLPHTLDAPKGTRGTELNAVHAPTTTMPRTLDAHKGSGPGGPTQSRPVGAAKLSAPPPPKPPGPHPVMPAAAPHPPAPHPVAHGGSPPNNKKKPNG